MKIYILCDMEGISGIRRREQVDTANGGAEYEEGRKLMMADMNVAIDAAFSAGAEEVVACDTHGGGGQIRVGDMDERAIYETPGGGCMMPALDETFAGVILLGHHAHAGTLNAFLDHTMSSAAWFEYRINGRPVGELGIEGAYAGHFDVPVIAVSGDAATAAEARDMFGSVECAVVKWGIGRARARCLPLPKAHEAIRAAVSKAVSSVESYKPYKPELPATLELTYYRTDYADDTVARRTDVERVDARTVRQTVQSLAEIKGF